MAGMSDWDNFEYIAATREQANDDTGYYNKNKADMRIIYDTTLQILSSVQDQQEKTKQTSKLQNVCVFYPDTALGVLSRFCCRLPLFEEFGNISLIIWANGFPISSSFFRHSSNFSL